MRILSINNQYIIYARKKINIFMKCLYSNSFIKLDNFCDQHIEVTLSESIQGFSTKDIYIQQKAIFIISYIYQSAIVKENFGFVCYRVIDLVESYVYYAFAKLYFLELCLKAFSKILDTVIVLCLSIYFIYLICLFYLFIRYLSEIYLSKIYQVVFLIIFFIL